MAKKREFTELEKKIIRVLGVYRLPRTAFETAKMVGITPPTAKICLDVLALQKILIREPFKKLTSVKDKDGTPIRKKAIRYKINRELLEGKERKIIVKNSKIIRKMMREMKEKNPFSDVFKEVQKQLLKEE